jgi:hypothetical protein
LASTRRRSLPPPSEDVRLFTLHGVDYFIFWDHLSIGASFFLPTTATKTQAFEALQPYARYLGIQLQVRNRCEYGRYGVRVWRVY